MNNDAIDNALIAQKSRILSELDAIGEQQPIRDRLELYHEFLGKLEFVLPLWLVLSYGYKMNEIASRIADASRNITMAGYCMHKTTHAMNDELYQRAIKLGQLANGS